MLRKHRVEVGAIVAIAAVGAVVLITASSGSGSRPDRPVALAVDGMAAPLGLGPTDVQFGWQVGDLRRGAVQTSYRIVVRQGATVVWDSHRVRSADQDFIAYAGRPLGPDSVYQWTVQTWASSGGPSPLAPLATFETGLRDGDWQAQWIHRTPANPDDAIDQFTYARKELRLSSSPIVRARAYVSGDQQYELWVNGTRAGKGEAYSYPDQQYFETVDVTRLLRPGAANAIGILSSWQGATKGHPAGRAGAIMQLSVHHADGTTELVTSDGTWRVRRGAWIPGSQRDLEGDKVDFTEIINGPDEPVGWDRPGFDDRTWSPAVVIGRPPVAPWTHLVSVRTRIVEEHVPAVSLTRLASGAVVADFGQVFAAVPTVAFHLGHAGQTITMRAGFLLDPSGAVSTTHGTQHTDMSYTYIQRGGNETFHPFDYLGFRYFQVDDPGEALTAGDVVALTRHTAVPDEHAGTFASSDPTIDAIFGLGRHSALFTAQEQFLDTPTREKGPWLWDGFNESQTAMAALGDQNLTRKSLMEFAQSQARYWPQGRINKIYPTGLGAEDIAESSEIYPEWVWQYWLHTGDRTLLQAVYPVLVNLSDYVARAEAPGSGLVTRLKATETDINKALPVTTRENVLGVNVFRRTGDIAAALGRPGPEVTRQRARQTALTGSINTRLTRPDGTYVDGLQADGTQTPQASQHSNTVAVAYDVVPPDRLAAVGTYVAGLGMASEPQDAADVLETLGRAGRSTDYLRLLTDPAHDGWANILARGATFTWEVWQPSDANGDSMSHGWGSNVVVQIQRVLLGVTPTGPGYATFAVDPTRAGLTRASGRVPTPRGDVVVAWSRGSSAGAPFTLAVTVPANSTATVLIPASAVTSVTEGGRPVIRDEGVRVQSSGGGVVTLRVGAGTYQFRS